MHLARLIDGISFHGTRLILFVVFFFGCCHSHCILGQELLKLYTIVFIWMFLLCAWVNSVIVSYFYFFLEVHSLSGQKPDVLNGWEKQTILNWVYEGIERNSSLYNAPDIRYAYRPYTGPRRVSAVSLSFCPSWVSHAIVGLHNRCLCALCPGRPWCYVFCNN